MERPATGGCTMSPMAQGESARGLSSGTTSGTREGRAMSLDTGHLESFEQLVGVWDGTLDCGQETHQIRFTAQEQLANGVSGFFKWSEGDKWGREDDSWAGSGSLILKPNSKNGPTFTFTSKHDDFSMTADLTLFGADAMYGSARGDDDCSVSIGRRQTQDAEEG